MEVLLPFWIAFSWIWCQTVSADSGIGRNGNCPSLPRVEPAPALAAPGLQHGSGVVIQVLYSRCFIPGALFQVFALTDASDVL